MNVSSFYTSKDTNMQGFFFYCERIKYIDLQNFDISSVEKLLYVFTYCKSLLYLNLKNYKIINFEKVTLYYTFSEISPNVKYCIEDPGTKNFLIGSETSSCSDICFRDNIEFNFEKDECI